MVKIVLGGKNPPQGSGGQVNKGAAFANSDVKEDITSINRRLKMLEEKYTNLRSRSQVTEQNMLHKNKNFFTEIKALNIELSEVKKEMNELKDNIMIVIKEMDSFARKENIEILRKYIDLWNPVNFVTKNDVEAIVKEVINNMRREHK